MLSDACCSRLAKSRTPVWVVEEFSQNFSIAGSLDSVEGAPDIDFFRITGVPGELVRADLQGASSGNGTLGDPFLGLFDGFCNLIDVNDDAGGLTG